MMKLGVIISPNWRDYAEKYLAACLASLAKQDYPESFKIYLVDNESSEASRDLVNKICQSALYGKEWMLLANEDNAGFAKGNNVALRQALADGCEALALINMDGVLDSHCLTAMAEVMTEIENSGAVQARIMLWPEQDKINSLGNVTHFLGFGYCSAYREKFDNQRSGNASEICYPSGAAVMLRSRALKQVGLFDEAFWMYNEDQDLGWRLWLAGWPTVIATKAIFYHQYQFAKSIKQFYWQDRNRLLAIFKNYDWRTLLLISPALLLSELGLWLASANGGWLRERLRVYADLMNWQSFKKISQDRKTIQRLRKVSDKQITRLFSGKILYQEINSPLVRAGNVFFSAYWWMVKKIIFW